MHADVVRLDPVGPYHFEQTLRYLRSAPSALLEQISSTGFRRALDIGSTPVVIQLERTPPDATDMPLTLTIWTDHLPDPPIDQTIQAVRRMLLLDVDGSWIEQQLAPQDPHLKALIQRYPGFRPVLAASPWEALVWAVLGQMLSGQAAFKLRRRLVEAAQHGVRLRETWHPLPPPPDWVARRMPEDLRVLGISRTKAAALIGVARQVVEGTLDLTARPPSVSAALNQLRAVAGIGPWTTQIVGLRGFGDLNQLPVGDAALQSAVGRAVNAGGQRLNEAQLQAHGARWDPYRGWATYLWWFAAQEARQLR
jgi:DNA-3-methyladenine glycosylase II